MIFGLYPGVCDVLFETVVEVVANSLLWFFKPPIKLLLGFGV